MSDENIINVNEVDGAMLDWLVASCEGWLHDSNSWLHLATVEDVREGCYRPSSDWSVAGAIIEREGIAIRKHSKSGEWYAMGLSDMGDTQRADWAEFTVRGGERYGKYSYQVRERRQRFSGCTPLIAAMRCYVSSKLDRSTINQLSLQSSV